MKKTKNQNPKEINVSASIFFLLVALIVIGIMGFFLNKLVTEKDAAQTEISNLKSEVADLQNTLYNLESKVQNNPNNTSLNTPENTNTANNVVTENTNAYSEITKSFDNLDALFVTNAIKNNDNTYTLKGVVYSQYTVSLDDLNKYINDGYITLNGDKYKIVDSDTTNTYELRDIENDVTVYLLKRSSSNTYYLEAQVQIGDVWKLTDSYKQITLDKDTPVYVNYTEETQTVDEVFTNYQDATPEDTTNPYPIFNFRFENGKCVQVVRVTSAI